MKTEPNFKSLSGLDPEEADLARQQEVGKVVSGAVPDHVKNGRMVTCTLKDATEQSVTHGLKRQIKGWHLISPSGDADHVNVIQVSSDQNVLRLKNLGATGSLSFSLWVF